MTSDTRHDPLAELSAQGVAVWLDDLSRELLGSGELQMLITGRHVVGVTTNPTIFASALAKGDRYDAQLSHLAELGASTEAAVFTVTTDDVRAACDVLSPVHQQTAGKDGRVSIEVDPRLARDAAATADMARALRSAVDRDNMFVKIPATQEGLTAITQATSEGISVNVTLIFALARYRAVMDAYLRGLEQAAAAGRDLAAIRSVASFFISRVDSEVDTRLDQIATRQATELKGKAAIANARLAYQAYEEVIASQRWQQLAGLGAQPQRPLWASTGIKNPAYPDTMYVTELVAAGTVNTMPGTTLAAFADHGEVTGNTITGRYHDARRVLDQLATAGVDFEQRHRTTRTRRPRQVREQLERAEPHHRRRTASQPSCQATLTPPRQRTGSLEDLGLRLMPERSDRAHGKVPVAAPGKTHGCAVGLSRSRWRSSGWSGTAGSCGGVPAQYASRGHRLL